MRSLATRDAGSEISPGAARRRSPPCKAAGFDLVIVETSGIGQGDAAIVPHVDVSLYVMTPEFGAASQLEKIDMLDFADFVAINKFDRKGAAGRAARRAQAVPAQPRGVQAAARRDAGVRHDRRALQRRRRDRAVPGARCRGWRELGLALERRHAAARSTRALARSQHADRAAGARALPRRDRRHGARLQAARARAGAARARDAAAARERRACCRRPTPTSATPHERRARRSPTSARRASTRDAQQAARACGRDMQQAYAGDEYVVKIRDKEIRTALDARRRCRARKIRKVALPRYEDHGEILQLAAAARTCPAASRSPPACSRSSARTRTRRACSPAKATRSAPTGASSCSSTGMPAKRLSTAFDSVTLYGNDPDRAARHLRQGRQLGRVDRDARRHEGAVLGLRPVRPERPRCR